MSHLKLTESQCRIEDTTTLVYILCLREKQPRAMVLIGNFKNRLNRSPTFMYKNGRLLDLTTRFVLTRHHLSGCLRPSRCHLCRQIVCPPR